MHALFSRNGLDVLHIGIFSQFSVATKPQKPVFVGCKRLSQRSYLPTYFICKYVLIKTEPLYEKFVQNN